MGFQPASNSEGECRGGTWRFHVDFGSDITLRAEQFWPSVAEWRMGGYSGSGK